MDQLPRGATALGRSEKVDGSYVEQPDGCRDAPDP